MHRIAQRFLVRCFQSEETIAILLRRESPRSVAQRVVCLETALEPRYQAWLAYENSTGANVYVAANPLRSGSRKRTKESIAAVRHLYLDIDTDGGGAWWTSPLWIGIGVVALIAVIGAVMLIGYRDGQEHRIISN